MIQYFPFNYFWVNVSPKRVFKYRHYLSIIQSIFVLLFLNALLLMPATIQLSKQAAGRLDFYSPMALEQIDAPFWQDFKQDKEFIDQTDDQWIQQGGLKPTEIDDSMLIIWFGADEFILKDVDKPYIQSKYTNKQALLNTTSVEEFKEELSNQWSGQYALSLRLASLMMVALLMGTNLFLLVAGSTFFLSLMRKSQLYTIDSIKEAFTITLNSLGLPTMITFICSLFTENLAALLVIHGLLFVLNLVASYWKTHFNDHYIEQSN